MSKVESPPTYLKQLSCNFQGVCSTTKFQPVCVEKQWNQLEPEHNTRVSSVYFLPLRRPA
jgi:hypothetical protein